MAGPLADQVIALAILAVVVGLWLTARAQGGGTELLRAASPGGGQPPAAGGAGPPPTGNGRTGGAAPAAAGRPRQGGFTSDLAFGYPYNYDLASADPAQVGENRLYSTAEVDPRVTGQLYAGPRAAGEGRRWIYGGRTSFGDKWGMHEFSTGEPGQAGVDVGLLGMREYSLDGKPDVFDDGIPENWRMPSTPVNWYVPQREDHYDVEAQGPAVYKKDLLPLFEPDHDPNFS